VAPECNIPSDTDTVDVLGNLVYQAGRIYLKIEDPSNVDLSSFPNIPDTIDSNNVIGSIFGRYGVTDVDKPFVAFNTTSFDRTYLISFTDPAKVNCLLDNLSSVGFIEYVEKVPGMYIDLISNDPTQPYHLGLINADGATDIYQTNPGASGNAVVAIIDDAVLTTHEDLAANMSTTNQDVADFDNDPNPPFSGPTAADGLQFSHGTHVAGIASGVTDNSLGIASIGWSCVDWME